MNFLRKIVYPFSVLYGVVTFTRNFLYDIGIFKSAQFNTPTIVVGNLSVGGTGKTPQIEYLIRLLQDKYTIAVLSRGYKRKSKGFVIAKNNVNAEIIGDEPYQLFLKFPKIIVCVDSNRRRGIKELEKLQNPPDVILLDDAFQHRKVRGGFNILLTPYYSLYTNDTMLPTGNLREFALGAKRAQFVVVTKCPDNLTALEQQKITDNLNLQPHQKIFFSTIEYDKKLRGYNEISLTHFVGEKILLVTGIANSKPLTTFLSNENIEFIHLKYPDHYNFNNNDIEKMKAFNNSLKSIILTTEKDYVRIFDNFNEVYYISIRAKFINDNKDFDNTVEAYVEQSTRDS